MILGTTVFSLVPPPSYTIVQPRRGINFGPVAFNADTVGKTFELKNEGEFEFVFAVQVRNRIRQGAMGCDGDTLYRRNYSAACSREGVISFWMPLDVSNCPCKVTEVYFCSC